jgi:hypothetical protein
MQGFNKDNSEYKKNHVSSSLLIVVLGSYAGYPFLFKAALTAQRDAVQSAETKHSPLQHKIGKL